MKHLSAWLEHSKLFFGLLIMFGMAYVFTHYLDGDIGVVVWSFLILAPLISLFLSRSACRKISAEWQAPSYCAKGKTFTLTMTVHSESRLPVPFLRCRIHADANFSQEDNRIVQSAMTSAEPLEIPYQLTAEYAGCAEVSVQELSVSDYLGWFNFPVNAVPETVKIGIIPEIPSLSNANIILHTVSDIVLTQDDEEEESAAAFSAQSMPGYIHREYVAGDSLKRINWKMSAKRQKLLVRMDEAAATVRPAVILDLQPETSPEALKRREIILEGALGFLLLLVQQGIPCTIRYSSENVWKSIILENEDAVRNAAVELAIADFTCGGNRLDPTLIQEKVGAYLIYTAHPDENLALDAARLKDSGYLCAVCLSDANQSALSGFNAVWTLNQDFAMQNLKK